MSKENINLPKTSFSMKANLPTKEPEILKIWEKLNLYKKLREARKGKEKFILHDGPPYANGHIHMGTALNKILKDMVTKFHQMDGKDSVYVPGWDCHGLPIEWKIEEQYKKDKKNKDEVPIKNFRSECREFASKWIDIHIKEFIRLGVEGDWKNYYSTMSYDAEAQIVRELGKFLLDGSLYKGFKPVLWSTVEKTALADAEVEYKDHISNIIYASFKIIKTEKIFLKDSYIIIWTTTPWTIPANRALVYGSKIKYSVIQIGKDTKYFQNKKIIIATELIKAVSEKCNFKDFKILKEFNGSDFKNTICQHPFLDLGYDYDVPMLEGDFVTLEQGTGVVHAAPSHGPDDFNLCLKHGLKAPDTINDAGIYSEAIPFFSGMHIFKADPVIIDKLSEFKSLLGKGKLQHSFPHSWRSKAPLVYRATPQWFISMEKNNLRKKALKAIDDTAFYPSKGKERIRSMIETRPDWCISRQRVWGVPLPIFVSKKTNEPLRDPEIIENIAKIYEKEGADCWFDDNPEKFLGKNFDIHGGGLDLVFPHHENEIAQSCAVNKTDNFANYWMHNGYVTFDKQKMSKSLGNIVTIQRMRETINGQVVRLALLSSHYKQPLDWNENLISESQNILDKWYGQFEKITMEDLPENIMNEVEEQTKNITRSINEILEGASIGMSIREGFLIAILGKPNTGKSSFINKVSDKDISIVTSQPGTTRDLIESFIDINGYPFRFVDTAGIRESSDLVEKIGVNKALTTSKEADVNLIFLNDYKDINDFNNIHNPIFVKSKQDLSGDKFNDNGYYNISSISGFGIKDLLALITGKINKKTPNEKLYISRERHIKCLISAKKQLEKSKEEKTVDLFAEDIRLAIKYMSELFGNVDIEDILDIIFSDFCIGK